MWDLIIKTGRYIKAWCKFHWHIFIGLMVCVFLIGCRSSSKIEKMSTEAEKSVAETLKALSPECVTPEINARLDSIKTQIVTIKTQCENEKKDLVLDKNYWRTIAFGLGMILIGVFLIKIKL